ncbi:MAG: transposase [Wendovervirus sonii]|uniref:Transposase n=1 Tax=phage Lak_Megaphage_Sonny TaxID=3109229 RepID=A0ABZ0Z3U5_9CAUD|nr:MAG: transposase [phage Lak_Megaphage_Sonny]
MKAKEALKLLKITRPTLTKYVKENRIKVETLPNGQYDYDEDSVLKAAKISTDRDSVIYARVSTQKQKKDLENQIQIINDYANSNGYKVSKVYADIASGLNYDRKKFNELLNNVLERKIKIVFIKDKDRLTRVSFDMWKELFKKFNCDLVVVNEDINNENSEKEIFADIISLLHCFAMKMYSVRRKKKLNLIKEDIENEIS